MSDSPENKFKDDGDGICWNCQHEKDCHKPPSINIHEFRDKIFLGIELKCPNCDSNLVFLIEAEPKIYSIVYRLRPEDMRGIETRRATPLLDPEPLKSKFECVLCSTRWDYDVVCAQIEAAVQSYLGVK